MSSAPPESNQLTKYGREHFATYLLLLDWSQASFQLVSSAMG